MASIDKRVVELKFNNSQFEKGVSTSLNTLQKLKNSLQFGKSKKSLTDLEKTGKKFQLNGVTKAINLVNKRFSTLGIIGTTALQEITKTAMRTGSKIVSAITNPIIEGGKNRAMNIEQAKFQFEGLGINIEKAMASALEAVQGTAYGLDEAARVASQFGASGMTAGDEMTKSLRAVSGVAAMTGSGYSEIGNIFVQVAGQGRLMGDQLMQLSGRGINAAATLAKQMGKTEKEVREMVTDGDISFKTFYTAMDNAFGAHAKDANKVFTGALANMKAALARIGAEVAGPGLVQFRDFFNTLTPVIDNTKSALMPLIDSINKFVEKASKAAQIKLKNVKVDDLNNIGFALDNLFHAFGNIFAAIGSYISPFTKAIKNMIPKDASGRLVNLTADFYDFTEKLALSKKTGKTITSIFTSLFSIIGTGASTISKIIKSFIDWIQSGLKPVNIEGASVLEFIDNILKAFDKGFSKGVDEATKSFKKFGDVLKPVKDGLNQVRDAIVKFGSNVKTGLVDTGTNVSNTFDGILSVGKAVWNFLKKAGSEIKKIFSGVSFTDLVDTGLLAGAVIAIQKIYGSFSKNAGSFLKSLSKSLEKISNSASGALNAVKSTLESYQKDIKATTILKIAAAVGILAGSVYALSQVDVPNLGAALGSVTALLGEVVATLAILNKMKLDDKKTTRAAASMILISVAVAELAKAMSRLSAFEKPGEMLAAAGAITIVIGALTGAMAGLTVALKKTSFDSAGTELIKASAAMILLSQAVMKLSKAIKLLGEMDANQLKQGEKAMGIILGALLAFTKAASKVNMKGLASTIAAVATSVLILQTAIRKLGEMDPEVFTTGFKRMGKVLTDVVIALNLLRGVNIKGAATTILAIAAALNLLIIPIAVFGKMKLTTLAQGILGCAGAIAVIGIAMKAIPKNFAGAVGLAALAAALTLLVPQIAALGSLELTTLMKGIGAIGASLVVLANAVRILAPLTPALIGLAGAFTLFGAGVTLVGAGIALLSLGLVTLSGSTMVTTAAIAAFLAAIPPIAVELAAVLKVIAALAPSIEKSLSTIGRSIINVLGAMGKAIVKNIIGIIAQIVKSIGKKADLFMTAGIELLTALLKGVNVMFPRFLDTGLSLIIKFIKVLTDKMPKLIDAGEDLIMSFLSGMLKMIPKVAKKGLEMLLEFLEVIKKNIQKVVEVGGDIVINFLKGLNNKVPKIIDIGMKLVTNVLTAIKKNIKKMVTAGIGIVTNFLDGVQESLPKVIDKGFKLMIAFINGMADGIRNNTDDVLKAVGNMITAVLEALYKAIKKAGPVLLKVAKKLVDEIPKAIKSIGKTIKEEGPKLIKKLATAILEKRKELIEAGKNMIKGFIKGIGDSVHDAVESVKDMGKKVVNGLKDVLGIHSPSKVAKELGGYFIDGFAEGVSKTSKVTKEVTKSITTMTKGMKNSITTGTKVIKKALKEIAKEMKYGGEILDNYWNAFGISNLSSGKGLARFREEIKKSSKAILDYGKSLYKETDAYKEDTASLKQHKKELKKLNAERSKAAKKANQVEKDFAKNEAKRKKEEDKWKKIANDKKSTKDQKKFAKEELERIEKERQKDKERVEEAKGYYQELGKAVKETNKAIMEDQTNMANHTVEAFNAMKDTVKESMASMVDLFSVDVKDLDAERDSIKSSLASMSNLFDTSWIKESDLIDPIKSAIQSINDIFNTSLIVESTDILEPIKSTLTSMVDLFSTSFVTAADMTDPIKSTLESWTDAFGVAYTKVTDLFTKFESDYEGTTEDIIANMKSQVDGVKEWRENLTLLASRGLSTDFLKTLEDLGPSSAGMIKRFTEMTDEELAEASSLFAESSALAAQSFVDGYKSQNDQIEQMGKDMLALAEKGFNEALLEELANKGSGAQEFIKLYLAMTPEQVQSINDEYKRSLTLEDSVTNDILQSFGYAGVDSAQSFIDGFASKQEELKKLGEDMLTLSGMGFDSKILEDLSAKGSDARSYIDLFMGMTREQVNQLNLYYQNNLSIQNTTAQAIADSYGAVGTDSVQAYIDGVKDKNEEVEQLGKDLLELSKRGFDKALLESLGAKGEGARSFIDLYMQMDESQIAELNKEFARSFQVQDDTAHDILESYGKAGVDSAQTFIDGFIQKQDEMAQIGSDMMELNRRGFNQALLEEVAKQGEGAREFIELFMTMTGPQIAQLNAYYQRNLALQGSTTEAIMKSYGVTGQSAAQGFIEGFKSQNDSAEQMGKDLVTLAKLGFDQGILESLGTMGEGAQPFIDTFLQMTPQQIQTLNEQYKRSLTIPDSVAEEIMASYAYAGTKAGENFLDSLAEYAKDAGSVSAKFLAENFAEGSNEEMQTAGNNVGDKFISGITDTIAERRGDISDVGTNLSSDLTTAADTAITPGLTSVGENAIAGLISGIEHGRSSARDIIIAVAMDVANAMESTLGIHSPSRVFKQIGRFTIEGFAQGIEKTSKVATEAMSSLSDALIKEATSTVNPIDNFLGDRIDPVIKPVIDLSNVKNGLNDIDTALSKQRALNLSASIESAKRQSIADRRVANDSSTNGKQVVNNFTQNNYSPKALSSVDIYRQTKNQLSRLRTVM